MKSLAGLDEQVIRRCRRMWLVYSAFYASIEYCTLDDLSSFDLAADHSLRPIAQQLVYRMGHEL